MFDCILDIPICILHPFCLAFVCNWQSHRLLTCWDFTNLSKSGIICFTEQMTDAGRPFYCNRACFSVFYVSGFVCYPSAFAETDLFMDISFVKTTMQPKRLWTRQQMIAPVSFFIFSIWLDAVRMTRGKRCFHYSSNRLS